MIDYCPPPVLHPHHNTTISTSSIPTTTTICFLNVENSSTKDEQQKHWCDCNDQAFLSFLLQHAVVDLHRAGGFCRDFCCTNGTRDHG